MVNILKNLHGTDIFLKEPLIFIWLAIGLSFLAVSFSSTVALIYGLMLGASVGLYLLMGKNQIRINSVPGNSIMSFGTAMVLWIVFVLGLNILIMGAFGGLNSSAPTFSAFFELHSTFSLGATRPVLADSKVAGIIVFGIIIPIIETYLLLKIMELVLKINKIPIGTRKLLTNLKFWAINVIMAVGAVYFHIQAKGLGTLIPLVMVFTFFLLTGVVGFVPIASKKPEKETSIWLHIINNMLAVLKTLKII